MQPATIRFCMVHVGLFSRVKWTVWQLYQTNFWILIKNKWNQYSLGWEMEFGWPTPVVKLRPCRWPWLRPLTSRNILAPIDKMFVLKIAVINWWLNGDDEAWRIALVLMNLPPPSYLEVGSDNEVGDNYNAITSHSSRVSEVSLRLYGYVWL